MLPEIFCPYIRDADFAPRSPWCVSERRLLDYLLIYIQEGECEFKVNGFSRTYHTRDFCLAQPGQTVELTGKTYTITPYLHFDIWFNSHRENSFATRPGQLDLTAYLHFLQPTLDSLASIPTKLGEENFSEPDAASNLRRIINLWNDGTKISRIESENMLGALILGLVRTQNEGKATQSPNTVPLGWVPSYFSTHLSDTVSVEEMAARARLSTSRFQAVFKERFGTSPARYLVLMRVRHAEELLETSDWTLAHIARLCGFADVHHFAKVFKKVGGKTPGEVRREKRGV
jgi:AraC-like DNA-binding protein